MFLGKKLQKINSKILHRKLGNFKKIPEMLGLDVEFPVVLPIAKFRRFFVKNFKKISSKTFYSKLGNLKKVPEMLRLMANF